MKIYKKISFSPLQFILLNTNKYTRRRKHIMLLINKKNEEKKGKTIYIYVKDRNKDI